MFLSRHYGESGLNGEMMSRKYIAASDRTAYKRKEMVEVTVRFD